MHTSLPRFQIFTAKSSVCCTRKIQRMNRKMNRNVMKLCTSNHSVRVSAGRFRFRLRFRELEQKWGNHSGKPCDSRLSAPTRLSLPPLYAPALLKKERSLRQSAQRMSVWLHYIFLHYHINGKIFGGWGGGGGWEINEHKTCLFSTKISQAKKNSTIYHLTYIRLRVNYQLFLSEFNGTRMFSTYFRQILISNAMTIRPMGGPSCSVRADGHG
jgi:hypothetical protein